MTPARYYSAVGFQHGHSARGIARPALLRVQRAIHRKLKERREQSAISRNRPATEIRPLVESRLNNRVDEGRETRLVPLPLFLLRLQILLPSCTGGHRLKYFFPTNSLRDGRMTRIRRINNAAESLPLPRRPFPFFRWEASAVPPLFSHPDTCSTRCVQRAAILMNASVRCKKCTIFGKGNVLKL